MYHLVVKALQQIYMLHLSASEVQQPNSPWTKLPSVEETQNCTTLSHSQLQI